MPLALTWKSSPGVLHDGARRATAWPPDAVVVSDYAACAVPGSAAEASADGAAAAKAATATAEQTRYFRRTAMLLPSRVCARGPRQAAAGDSVRPAWRRPVAAR